MAIAAEVLRIRDVFSAANEIKVPPFQRNFAWGEEETNALLNDLTGAFENSVIYFLGAMVVIRPKGRGTSDVVDGQQRLTCLTIILAVLRDLAATSDEQALLHTMVGHETLSLRGGARWRMTLNTLDTPFFRMHVQARGSTNDQQTIRRAIRDPRSESQARLAKAVVVIYDYLSDMDDAWRTRFATWLLDEVTIVRVRVSEYAVAYKVFQSLNQRGKQLNDHDILKSALMDRAGVTAREAVEQSVKWNEYTNRLGDKGFADMLKQVRAIYDRNQVGELVDGLLQSIGQRMTVMTFLEEKLPHFVDAYDALINGNTEAITLPPEAMRRLTFLRSIHHESWRAPAILFLVNSTGGKNADDADRFFKALERLAYKLQYSVRDREARHRRYRRVLDTMIDRPNDLYAPESALNLSERDSSELLERLRGRFPNFKQRRALLMRFSAAVPGGEALDPDADTTVEHILPRTPPRGSDWFEEWAKAKDRDELTECIGNFTLLTHDENQEADTKAFKDKLELYFRTGKPSYALSNDLEGRKSWTPDDVRQRRDALIAHLKKDWEL
ncbi:MAG TPA: DUF262 domain-containing HNH endonuclease family protein [Hyphomonadaceae bacterium]|nr:DUF262 domain-containing HNH endonuclease family protein [Hyphomonadaceae bacterium]